MRKLRRAILHFVVRLKEDFDTLQEPN
jgi:hypothetical protein